jgi:hypothetical protein
MIIVIKIEQVYPYCQYFVVFYCWDIIINYMSGKKYEKNLC